MLWQLDELVLLVACFAGLLVATEIGFRMGRRRSVNGDDSAKTHIESMTTAVLGLLALLLGFTFFMAASRLETRKSLVLEEANAIGTTHLRSQLLPSEQRGPVKQLLREEIAARLEFHRAGIDPIRIEATNREADRIEKELSRTALDFAAQDPHSVTAGMFMESVNAILDLHEKRQVALDNHVPEPVLYVLLVVSVVAFALLGCGCGLQRRRRFASNTLFALLIVFVLTTILDMDRPRRGFIQVPQDSLLRLQAVLQGDAG